MPPAMARRRKRETLRTASASAVDVEGPDVEEPGAEELGSGEIEEAMACAGTSNVTVIGSSFLGRAPLRSERQEGDSRLDGPATTVQPGRCPVWKTPPREGWLSTPRTSVSRPRGTCARVRSRTS